MTETRYTSTYGAEYDAQFTTMTLLQLRDALLAAEAEYRTRCDHWDTCHLAVGLANETQAAAVGTPAFRDARQHALETRAAMRGAHALATEQGKIVAALNRAIIARAAL